MLNRVDVIGRLVVEPELKTTGGGTQFVKGRIAVQRDYPKNNGQPNAQGYKEYESDFIPFSIWGKQANFASTLVKGQMVAMTGRWQTSQYQDQQGQKQTGHELNVESYYALDKKNQEDNNGGFNQQPQQNGFGQNQGGFNQQPQQNGFGQNQGGFNNGGYNQQPQQNYQAPPPPPNANGGFNNGNSGGFNANAGFNQPGGNFNQPTNFNR